MSHSTFSNQALVIDLDDDTNNQVAKILSEKGFEVKTCNSGEEARRFFRRQSLVVAGRLGENGETQDMVDFVRNVAGAVQPYVMTLAEGRRAYITPPGPGVNDVVAVPLDHSLFGLKVDAAKVWLSRNEVFEVTDEPAEEEDFSEPEPKIEPEPESDSELEVESEMEKEMEMAGLSPESPTEGAQVSFVEQKEVETIAMKMESQVREDIGHEEIAPVRAAARRQQVAESTPDFLRAMLESCPAGIAMFDLEMNYLAANRRWKRCFGLEAETLPGRNHFDIFLDVPPEWQSLCDSCIQGSVPQSGSELVEWEDGTQEWVRWTMTPWAVDKEEGITVSFETIPDPRPALPPKSGADHDLASSLAQSNSAPVVVLDLDGHIIRSNRLARQRIGRWSTTEIQPRYTEVFLKKEDRADTEELLERFADAAINRGEFRFPAVSIESVVQEDGRAKRYAWHNFPRHAADGSVIGMVRVGIDSVDLVPNLESAQRDFTPEMWMEMMPQPFFRIRRDGSMAYFNSAWLKFRECTLAEELEFWQSSVHDDDLGRLRDALADLDVDGGHLNLPARLQDGSGQFRWFRFRVEPNRYGNSSDSEEWVGYLEDLSNQKHLEEQLGQLQQNYDELKRKFSAGDSAIERVENDLAALEQEKSSLAQQLAAALESVAQVKTLSSSLSSEKARAEEILNRQLEAQKLLEEELAQTQSDLMSLRDSTARMSDERERFSSIAENAPFGLIVLGRDGVTHYANPAHLSVIGSDVRKVEAFEEWLKDHCPDQSDEARDALSEGWRENVWRKQQTKVFPLRADDDSVRDLEFRPKMLRDGQFLMSVFDVTDARRSEEALKSSEAKFRALFRDVDVGIALGDGKGRLLDANPALEKIVGMPRMDILRLGIDPLFHEEDRPARAHLVSELKRFQSRSKSSTFRLIHADGTEITVDVQVSLIRTVESNHLFTAYFFRKRPTSEETGEVIIEKIVEKIVEVPVAEKPAFNRAPDAMALIDRSQKILRWIPGSDRSLAWNNDSNLEDKSLTQALPFLGPEFDEILGKSIASAEPSEITAHHNGQDFLVKLVPNGEDQVVVSLGNVLESASPAGADSNANAEPGISEEELRKLGALQSLPDAVVLADLKGRIVDFNRHAAEMWGFDPAELVGKGIYILFTPDDPKGFKKSFSEGISKNRVWEEATIFTRKDGSTDQCLAKFVPILDEKRKPVGLVGICRKGEAPAASADSPSSNAGHSGYASSDSVGTIAHLLDLQASTLKEKSARKAIDNSRARIRAIESLHLQATPSSDTVDFGKFARELVQQLLEEIGPEETGIEVHLNVKNILLPLPIAERLAIILHELVSNSLLHAFNGQESGIMAISASLKGKEGWLSIKDDGTGLPDWLHIDDSPGLGLQIVQDLAAELSGHVQLGDGLATEIQVNFFLDE